MFTIAPDKMGYQVKKILISPCKHASNEYPQHAFMGEIRKILTLWFNEKKVPYLWFFYSMLHKNGNCHNLKKLRERRFIKLQKHTFADK